MTGRAYTTAASGQFSAAYYGAVSVVVSFADDGPTTPPAEPTALGAVEIEPLTYDTPGETPLGVGHFGGAVAVTMPDPDGTVRTAIEASVRATDVMLTVESDDGHGGTLTWMGFPDVPDADATLSPLVYAAEPLACVFRDVVALAEDAEPSGGERPADAVRRLQEEAEFDAVIRHSYDLVADGVTTAEADVIYASPPDAVGGSADGLLGAGDSLADQLDAVCKAETLALYQTLRQAVPEIHLVPRSRLGDDLADGSLTSGADPEGYTFPTVRAGRTVTVEGDWTADGSRVRRRFPPRRLTLVLPEGSLLSRNSAFAAGQDYWPTASGTPLATYSAPPAGPGNYLSLDAGDAVTQAVGRVSAGTRIGLGAVRAWTVLAPVAGDGETPRGALRLTLTDGVDTYAYGSGGWVTGSTPNAPLAAVTDDEGQYVLGGAPGTAGGFPLETLLTAPAPIEGDVSLRLIGDATPAVFYRVEAYLADDDGDLVTRLASPLAVSRGAGEAVEIAVPAHARYNVAEVTGYVAAGVTYTGFPAALASVRLAQTSGPGGQPLRVVTAEIPGLIGPDTRVTFTGAGLPEPITGVFCGGALDFKRGTTTGTWCEIRTDGLT